MNAKTSAETVTKSVVNRVAQDLNAALETIGKNHGLVLSAATANISKRGKVTIAIKGGKGKHAASTKNVVMSPKPQGDETLAEFRMRVHHKQVGLPMSVLHKAVKISGKAYEVMGLRGKAHKVVLQPKDGNSSKTIEMLPSVFKEKYAKSLN